MDQQLMVLVLRLFEYPRRQQLLLLCIMETSNYGFIGFICTRFSSSLHQQPIQQLLVLVPFTLEFARRQQLAIAARREKTVC